MCFDFGIRKYNFKNSESFDRTCRFSKNVYFCSGKTLKGEKIMAKPIEATPVLEGTDALAFIAEMEKNEKASKEEKMRIKADADIIRSMLTFVF